jgi:tripartite-type tricarboxylate transporter receptor subunit TctC
MPFASQRLRGWARCFACTAAVVTVSLAAATSGWTQTYPTKPVRMIVPFPPGGATDIYSRLIAQKLSEGLSQQVVVDNRGGAGGIIAAELAAKSAPDGHTLFFGGAGVLSITPTSAKRTAIAPQIPTIAESGVPGYELTSWYAMMAPAATPSAAISRLNHELVKALDMADVKKRFIDLGADPFPSTPQALAAFHREQIAKFSHLIKVAGIKPE